MVGWVGAGMEVVDDMHAGQSQGGWSHVALGMVEPELVGLPG